MCNNILNLPVGRCAGAHGPVRRDAINRLCVSLDDPVGRGEFGLNEDAYCLRFGLDKDERQAVKDRDLVRLIELGGYVVHLNKLAALCPEAAAE